MLKLYPNGSEHVLSVFINEKETIIDRFQDVADTDFEKARDDIYRVVVSNFASLMQ